MLGALWKKATQSRTLPPALASGTLRNGAILEAGGVARQRGGHREVFRPRPVQGAAKACSALNQSQWSITSQCWFSTSKSVGS